ncbi:MAG TPA: zeta toxin family protein [Alphaproteobacteria bacterium]|nr:zeta toxin family protein [Alphaproteobacteria bacterium]
MSAKDQHMSDLSLTSAFGDEAASAKPDLMTDAEYAVAYKKMAADLLEGREAQTRPALLYVTGLPGSGKSTFVKTAQDEQPQLKNYVHINFDDLRVYHPRYEDHVKNDPINAAARIDTAVEGLIGWLTEEAAKRQLNVLMDDAAMGQDMTRMVLFPFRENGYDISAVVISTPSVVARQSVHMRFEENYAAAKQGQDVIPRWVNREEQDNAPAAMVETVETLENEKLVDRMVIIDRLQNVLYAMGKMPETNAGEVVRKQQQRELRPDEVMVYQNKAVFIAALMQARENLPANTSTPAPAASQQKKSPKRALGK